MKTLPPESVSDSISLPDESRLVLVDVSSERYLSRDNYSRNVFRLSKSGEVLWQIKSAHDNLRSSFVQLFKKDVLIGAYRETGEDYSIDIESGYAVPIAFRK